MPNLARMHQFFDSVDQAIEGISAGDAAKREDLERLLLRVLLICDGLEGPDLEWTGIALVAREDLPDTVEEVNDGFLHDAWSERDRTRSGA
jgi:hypothetical protein